MGDARMIDHNTPRHGRAAATRLASRFVIRRFLLAATRRGVTIIGAMNGGATR